MPQAGRASDARLLQGRYVLGAALGRGSFGDVYEALDTTSQESSRVAVKRVRAAPPRGRANAAAVKPGLREVQLLRRCAGHPNIIGLVDAFQADDGSCWYVVLEYGGTRLQRVVNSGLQQLTPPRRRSYMIQICSALGHIHRQSPPVVHRDLSPTNILVEFVSPSGGVSDVLKLADFGSAHSLPGGQSVSVRCLGTLWYRAPELIFEEQPRVEITPAVDVWAAGCLHAELFIRRPLFAGNDDRHMMQLLKAGWPAELCKACRKATKAEQEVLKSLLEVEREGRPEMIESLGLTWLSSGSMAASTGGNTSVEDTEQASAPETDTPF